MMRSVWWALGAAALPLNAWAQTAPAGQVEAPPAAVTAPPAPPALPEELTPQPGGMTAEMAAARAIRVSAQMRAARANTEAADAARSEAAYGMIPQVSVSARYTRLSEITQPSLGGPPRPGLVYTQIPPLPGTTSFGTANFNQWRPACRDAQGSITPGTQSLTGGQFAIDCGGGSPLLTPPSAFTFPVILDQIAFRGTLTVPLTDIPFRLARVYEAAGLTAQARRLDEASTRSQVATDARVAFYEYMRAQGNLAIAQRGFETAQRHREDLARFVEAGTVARVELLRVEAQVAESERVVISARESVGLAEAQLRQRLHMPPGERVTLGEALDAPVDVPGGVESLLDRAMRDRPEIGSLERQTRALDANLAATRAAMFPSLVAQANIDIANPNQRFIPQSQEFNTTWDVNLILQWSPTGAIQTGATANRVASQRDAVRAQLDALREGLEIEVRGTWVQVQSARAAIEAARRQVAFAEESYRVRRERFLAGAAVSSDLTDAELDLMRARLAAANAHVDLRVALARLRRAVGTPEASR